MIESTSGSFRSQNYVVTANSAEMAKKIALAAEDYRKKLALEWLGRELPPQTPPLAIHAYLNLHSEGRTDFMPTPGGLEPLGMEIGGPEARLLDSVLPHEILHTVLARAFTGPVPRWADEGICMTTECEATRQKHSELFSKYRRDGKLMPLKSLLQSVDYPDDFMILYTQGHSLTNYLLERKDKATLLAFLNDGMRSRNWEKALFDHYGFASLNALESAWKRASE